MALSIQSFPRAIVHIDGDTFFASCEVAMNPSLRGKPVVTGKERGIVSSLSREAKTLGVTRGMSIHEVARTYPQVVILPSDYETYSLFSKRMFEIVRRYTPEVEEYSIDECFADLTGLRRSLNMSYERMAEKIKQDLENELGMTFSVGLGPNKSIAKIGSRLKTGLVVIPAYSIHHILRTLPVGKIWGVGGQTTAFFQKFDIKTALQFAEKRREWVYQNLTKPHQEIWEELHGNFVFPLTTDAKHEYKSISKTKTFTPPSTDRVFVFSQLSKNIENACIKARRHKLATKKIFFFLKTQEFAYRGLEITLTNPTASPNELVKLVGDVFDEVYRQNIPYRATGIVLMDLSVDANLQPDLFGSTLDLEKWRRVYATVDALDNKYGKHTVFLSTTLNALRRKVGAGERGDTPHTARDLFKGENSRQRLGMPMLGTVS
jgi:DNA polymerase-4/DNA polymerase V